MDGFHWHSIDILITVVQTTKTLQPFLRFCCRALHCVGTCVWETSCFRWKQLPLNLYRDLLESLLGSLQTVVCHALHVAVHTEPHVTPAAYPLAVQFNQADDMQHDIPRRNVPLAASLCGGLLAGGVNCRIPHWPLWSTNQIGLWFRRNVFTLCIFS